MNKKHLLKVSAALAIFLGILASCVFKVESITLPSEIKVGSTIEISTRMSCFHIQSTQTSNFIFGILVPSDWNAAENTTVTFSTENRQDGQGLPDVSGTMHIVDPSAKDPATGLTWSAAFQSTYGSCGNYGLTEWVIFESDEAYDIIWMENKTWYINAKIVMKVPQANTRFFFANAFCGTTNGFTKDDNGEYYSNALVETFTVTGGSGMDDYTTPPLSSVTPLKYTFEDIFSVNFTSKAGETVTDLYGVSDVYLQASCTLASGKTVSVTEKSDKTLMKQSSDVDYYKYIYPREFFGVGSSDKIESISVWFSDKSGSKKEDKSGYLYLLSETGTPLN